MVYIIAKWLVGALSIILVAEFLEAVTVSGVYIALIVALLWGLLNIFVRPLLFFITLPINILTFGLFTFVINGLLFLFLASFVEGFDIAGFWWAVFAAALIAIINWAGNEFISSVAANAKQSTGQ